MIANTLMVEWCQHLSLTQMPKDLSPIFKLKVSLFTSGPSQQAKKKTLVGMGTTWQVTHEPGCSMLRACLSVSNTQQFIVKWSPSLSQSKKYHSLPVVQLSKQKIKIKTLWLGGGLTWQVTHEPNCYMLRACLFVLEYLAMHCQMNSIKDYQRGEV